MKRSNLPSPSAISSSSSVLSRLPRVVSSKTIMTPSACWLSWDDLPSTPTPDPYSPTIKKSRLKGGQTTLTQLMEVMDEAIPLDISVPPEISISSRSVPPLSNGFPPIVDNNSLIRLIEELHENLVVLMEQLKTAYYWFNDPAFPQKNWIEKELPEVIDAIKVCPTTVSVMGQRDMVRYLPSVSSVNTFVLLKQLSIHHGFKILLDIDQETVNVTFKLQHELKNFGTNVFTHGTEVVLDMSIFEYED